MKSQDLNLLQFLPTSEFNLVNQIINLSNLYPLLRLFSLMLPTTSSNSNILVQQIFILMYNYDSKPLKIVRNVHLLRFEIKS